MILKIRGGSLLFVALCVLPIAAQAQEGEAVTTLPVMEVSHPEAVPSATALRVDEAIQIDGLLDEPVWSSGSPIARFTQVDPVEGAPATQRTEVRVAYDETAIYVGATLFDTGEIRTRLARRDGMMSESDFFEVVFDSYHDHQTAYRFVTNPSGMKRDELVSGNGSDDSWDPVWDVGTRLDQEQGYWSLEMRIPFSQLRFSRADEQVWGIQLERTIHRLQEFTQFSFVPKLERGGPQRFGHLSGIRDIEPGRRLELLPYLTARAEYIDQTPPPGIGFENTFRDESEMFAGTGLDLKYRLSSNVTLDATVNPDFGQVEVDPAVINLSAFETRFEERRPFFIEGAEIFRFGEGGPTGSTGRSAEVLYSRRIGRRPQGVVPGDAVFVEEPTASTILGAAKLTGKLGGGWSVGLLEAVTGREDAKYLNSGGVQQEVEVEPVSNYLIARVRRDVRGGATRFGAILTALHRDLSAENLERRLHSSAYTAGVDLVHEWDNRSWRIASSLSPSLVIGDEAALLRTQQTSSRYFQRPDADHLAVDSTATRLTGYYAMAELSKLAGAVTARASVGATSPGYEVNDIGFQSYADRVILDTNFAYTQTRPGPLMRNWTLFGGPDNVWNYDGQVVLSNVNLAFRTQFANYWSAGWRVEVNPEYYDDRLTRGGPLSRVPAGVQIRADVGSDSRRPYRVSANAAYSSDEGGSWYRSTNVDFSIRPRENWSVNIGPNLQRRYSTAQYVTTITDPRATPTHRRRYIFADLDQTTFSVDTRLNVTFTPVLSFELYAQPFLSSGDYGTPKELREPGTFSFLTYGEDVGTVEAQGPDAWRVDPTGDDPSRAFRVSHLDFTLSSLLGNAVLRWEWRPGSTIYLVWQQSREEDLRYSDPNAALADVGRLDLGPDALDLFGIRPNNIFAIKMNYWLNP